MRYRIVYEDEPFPLKCGVHTDKTVIVKYLDEDSKIIDEKRYGYLEKQDIINIKNTDSSFILQELFLEDFNIHEYRSLFEWEDYRTISSFHIEKCFFQGDLILDNMVFGEGGFSLAHCSFGNGKIDFHKTVFLSETVNFSGIKMGTGEKIFSSTKFHGKIVHFFSTDFGNGDVNFKCSNFENAHLNFSGAIFGEGIVEFDFTVFGVGGVDFSGSDFGKGGVSFRNTNFHNGEVIFFGSSFSDGKISFSDTSFGNGNIDFSFCQLKNCTMHFKYAKTGLGKFNMNNIKMEEGYILFKSVRFRNRSIYFLDSVISNLNFLNCLFVEHVVMGLEKCDKLTVENCIVEKTFDMIPTNKKEKNVGCINFINTKNLGHIYLDWIMNDVKTMIYAQGDDTSYIDKANQFRMLKENFHEIGQYNDEDYAYLEFRRCLSLSEYYGEDITYHKKNNIKLLRRKIEFLIKWFFLDFIGHYATNPFRILGTMIMTIGGFAFFYTLPFVILNGDKKYIDKELFPYASKLINALYHSLATMFTIGYGDINPGNIQAMIISGVQGFAGVFLMSYFTVAFVRKILR